VSKVWLVCVDLDGTLWDCPDVSKLRLPFYKISDESFRDSEGTIVSLIPGAKLFLEELKNHDNFITSTLSWNEYEKAYEALRLLQLVKYFDYIVIENHPRKDLMLLKLMRIIEREHGIKIKPNNIVYIDDRDIHIKDIKDNIGEEVMFIQIWKDSVDFYKLIEVVKEIASSDC